MKEIRQLSESAPRNPVLRLMQRQEQARAPLTGSSLEALPRKLPTQGLEDQSADHEEAWPHVELTPASESTPFSKASKSVR